MNAHDVATMVGACSSSYSAAGVTTSLGVMLGSIRLTTPAPANDTQARARVIVGRWVRASTPPPIAAPTAPAITLRRASRELADTSWSVSSTSSGTRAWRTTP